MDARTLTLGTRYEDGASIEGSGEPGDTSAELVVDDLIRWTAAGALIISVEKPEAGEVAFRCLTTVEQALRRYDGDVDWLGEILWHHGYRGDIAGRLAELWGQMQRGIPPDDSTPTAAGGYHG